MSLTFNREFDPDYEAVVQLSPLIRRVVARNPNPFTFTGTGVYLIGRGDVAVVDPGPTLDEHLDAVIGALDDGEKITRILITHTHTDHTAGVAKLVGRTGATTFGFGPHGPVPERDPLDQVSFDEYFTPEEKADFEKQWNETPDELRREGPDQDFVPDVAVGDGDIIHGGSGEGSFTIEVVHTPGHTSNHICFALREEKVLFTGDHVMGWATSVISPPDGDLFDYMNSLRKLLERDDETYWPTHGPAITDPKPYVQGFIDHRGHREQQIVSALHNGSTTIKDLVPAMYADVDKRLWRAAANSVYSHLLALHREGRVAASRDSAAPAPGAGSPADSPSLSSRWTLSDQTEASSGTGSRQLDDTHQ